ncbi:hypothetical protein Peur_017302 [Populus x canadensis]
MALQSGICPSQNLVLLQLASGHGVSPAPAPGKFLKTAVAPCHQHHCHGPLPLHQFFREQLLYEIPVTINGIFLNPIMNFIPSFFLPFPFSHHEMLCCIILLLCLASNPFTRTLLLQLHHANG